MVLEIQAKKTSSQQASPLRFEYYLGFTNTSGNKKHNSKTHSVIHPNYSFALFSKIM